VISLPGNEQGYYVIADNAKLAAKPLIQLRV
jgi:hypothetical protein